MSATVRVQVAHGTAVYADGRHHVGGEQVDVPAEVADQWQAAGWVTLALCQHAAASRRSCSSSALA